MEVQLAPFMRDTAAGEAAAQILRKCVHCGFCTATCPTYQLLGDERDGPRGRIYLIKQMLEGAETTARTREHLDRCLSCRACETTCPSGVDYGDLLDIGRTVLDRRVPRPWHDRLLRWTLRLLLGERRRFALLLGLGRVLRPLLPQALARQVPPWREPGEWPAARHIRRMLLLQGCVQPAIAPRINAACARVLDRLGISLIEVSEAGCCGLLHHHLGAGEEARVRARRNIDAWWPQIERGAEAIVISASACALMLKDYGRLLADDPAYAERAARIAGLARDIAEVLAAEDLSALVPTHHERIAFQSPCTLQHGQKLAGVVEGILGRAGVQLTPVVDAHLCCGSAGSYSLLQPQLSRQLLSNKLQALESAGPQRIATANIGCLAQLQSRAGVPVCHWIELFD